MNVMLKTYKVFYYNLNALILVLVVCLKQFPLKNKANYA